MKVDSRAWYDILLKIVKRAQAMGIAQGDHLTQMMDMEHAARQFNMRLVDWFNSDDFNFAHDFVGIQNHMDRSSAKVSNRFLPRFSGRD